MEDSAAAITTVAFRAMDVIAFALALVGLCHAWLWWQERERGTGWFGISFLALALFMGGAPLQQGQGDLVGFSPWLLWLGPALGCLSIGLVEYLNVPPAWRMRALAATLGPVGLLCVLIVFMGLSGATLPRPLAEGPVAAWFLAMGALAWVAGGRETGAGHRSLAAALLAVPFLALLLAQTSVGGAVMRYFGALAVIALGLTLLTVSLRRRRRELKEEVSRRSAAEAALTRLNTMLEHEIAARTADLQSLVGGLESFNRSVSQDLSGSLGGIGGLARRADASLKQGDDGPARRALPLIADQACKATQLLAALLSLARVGDMAMRREAVDLRRLAQAVVEQLKQERSGQPMPQLEIAADMPGVHADPELLKSALAHLIGNALKFTRETAGARIGIEAERADGAVIVRVRDNGVGFAAEAAQGLFSPFVRLHQERFDGHGVGLSIVRRAVERHGGRVWAEGQPGEGAMFSFSLPD